MEDREEPVVETSSPPYREVLISDEIPVSTGDFARRTTNSRKQGQETTMYSNVPQNLIKGPSYKKTRKMSQSRDLLEDEMTHEQLGRLHQLFEEADEDGGGGLDMEEFKTAMKKIMKGVSDTDLEMIFMKVDANCDGSVDWDEYLSYMLLEFKERVEMATTAGTYQALFTGTSFRDINSNHRDVISKVTFCPTFHDVDQGKWQRPSLDYGIGRYVSLDKTGILNFWNVDMQKSGVSHYVENRKKTVSLWLTDLVFLPNLNMIAISSTERDVRLYDISGSIFEKKFEITSMPNVPLCMDYYFDLESPNKAMLLIGDDGGGVYVVDFLNCIDSGLFGLFNDNIQGARNIPFKDLLKGKYKTVNVRQFRKTHDNWVEHIKYVEDLRAFLSCSKSGEYSLFVCDLEYDSTKAYFKVNKGIQCFDYCSKNNLIVTGCTDHMVRLWNPYVYRKPVSSLIGHMEAVTNITVCSGRDIFISTSKDRNIRIFDIQDHACLQNFQVRNFGTISSIFFNPKTEALLIASNELAIMEHKEEENRQLKLMSHDYPLCAALYNSLFNVVVSACQESVIRVWNLNTGVRTMQYKMAHSIVSDGRQIPVEITTMSFDPSLRRLLTGARDGSVKIWNFNNGDCLRVVDEGASWEITCAIFRRERILIAGWNRYVIVHSDSKDEDEKDARIWDKKHVEDILSIAIYDPRETPKDLCTVATSSYDGNILLWDFETGRMYAKLNLNESDHIQSFANLAQSKDENKSVQKNNKRNSHSLPKVNDAEVSRKLSLQSSVSTNNEDESLHSETKEQLGEQKYNADGKCKSGLITQNIRRQKHIHFHQELPFNKIMSLQPIEAPNESARLSEKNCKERSTGLNSRKHKKSVEKLLFLHSRKMDKQTAHLLGSGAQGWIQAWCIHPREGGLLGQFNASHVKGEAVVSMATDDNNEYLLTADTLGYVKVWDISEYCIANTHLLDIVHLTDNQLKFPYLSLKEHKALIFGKKQESLGDLPNHSTPPESSNPDVTYKFPPLLNSFRAHGSPITHLEYIGDKELIVTASTDGSIRLWSLCGRHIGIFGQKYPWQLSYPINQTKLPPKVPEDLQRIASATTLQVLNPGGSMKWRKVRSVVGASKTMAEMKRKSADGRTNVTDFKSLENGLNINQNTKTTKPIMKLLKAKESLEPELQSTTSKWKSIARNPGCEHQTEEAEDEDENSNDYSLEIPVMRQEVSRQSKLLGKQFKSGGHHKPFQHMEIKQIPDTPNIQVYPCLEFCKLDPIRREPTILTEIRIRYQLPSLDVEKKMEKLEKRSIYAEKLSRLGRTITNLTGQSSTSSKVGRKGSAAGNTPHTCMSRAPLSKRNILPPIKRD